MSGPLLEVKDRENVRGIWKKIQSREKKKQTGNDQDYLLGIEDSGLEESKREDSRE